MAALGTRHPGRARRAAYPRLVEHSEASDARAEPEQDDAIRPDSLRAGDPVELAFSKYDGQPHWTYPARFLGRDGYGSWIGGGAGTVLSRPGLHYVWDGDFVLLVPTDRAFVVTMNGPTSLVRSEFYVDITTVPSWHRPADGRGAQVRAVDLDLDVVRRFGERQAFLDDEDEFEEHRVRFGYPADLVETARSEAARVLADLSADAEPYRSVAAGWLARVSQPG